MKNIFLDFPEFIDSDPRIDRSRGVVGKGYHTGYLVNSKVQYTRHRVALPPDSLVGLSVLDLGCCVGASGAWVLQHGAKSYTGVEIESKLCLAAKKNLKKYFHNKTWQIKNQSYSQFFSKNKRKFDIVIAFGIIYSSIELEKIIEQIVYVAKKKILIDSRNPSHISKLKEKLTHIKTDFIEKSDIDKLAICQLVDYNFNNGKIDRNIKSAQASLPYLEILLETHSFILKKNYTEELTFLLKNEYNERFCVLFTRSENKKHTHKIKSYESQYKDDPNSLTLPKKWKFDKKIANDFVNHARHHIPNYEKVIEKTATVCKLLVPNNLDYYKIIDVGCATGHTIKKMKQLGFKNIVGVDASSDMLEQARKDGVDQYSTLIKRNTFPRDHGPYNIIICNWTLHFIPDKLNYLKDMYKSLLHNGFLFLSEKTYNDSNNSKLYYDFKTTQGLTLDEIKEKEDSIKGQMFINPPEWYINTLKDIGFDQVSIIDADFCFTSFLAIKK